ncbi:MAG TPA: hypothetical protein VIL36_04150, partial [Acidimicrobiales bacterium]
LATEAYDALGIDRAAGYFASRAAPMGAVSAEVVIATFYNFHPGLVRLAIPAAWEAATPEAIVEARFGAAEAALRQALGDEVVGSEELAWAASVARRAAESCDPAGRPLFGGHASLDWPDEPLLDLWHALTLLREYRGDGHVAALLLADVSPCEALHCHIAAADGLLPPDVLKTTRGWPEEDWQAAAEDLRSRGWLTADGQFTEAGRAAREQVEAATDERALAPWEYLGEETCDRLRATIRPWSRTIVQSGALGGR